MNENVKRGKEQVVTLQVLRWRHPAAVSHAPLNVKAKLWQRISNKHPMNIHKGCEALWNNPRFLLQQHMFP